MIYTPGTVTPYIKTDSGVFSINVNVTDITDESGYIEALGKKAAAKAINDAKRSVAEKNRDGSIGEAVAVKDQRISVAESNATAIAGENESKAAIAQSDAIRREKEAEAEQARRKAKGEADAIYATMEAQARGMQEILAKQAEGFKKIVDAAGGDASAAVQLMIADKVEELIKIQVEAVKNLNIDKITVWDSMGGNGENSTTANFLSNIMKSVPPLNEILKMAGIKMPEFLGTEIGDSIVPTVSPSIVDNTTVEETTLEND